MKIDILCGKAEHQKRYFSAFKKGLEKHGYTDIHVYDSNIYIPDKRNPVDLVVMWAHKNRRVIHQQKMLQKDYLVFERAYLGDRYDWVSAGYNGLNGTADFQVSNKSFDDTRVKKYNWGHDLKFVSPNHDKVALVIGQVSGDASLLGTNISVWYDKIIDELSAKGYYIIFREHPLSPTKYSNDKIKIYDSCYNLESVLCGTSIVVTYSSNTGVISSLYGLKTLWTGDCSMIKNNGFSSNSLEVLEQEKVDPDLRKEWLNRLSWCQWKTEELESGETWEHLKQKYNKKD